MATTWAHAVYSKEAYAPFGETYNEAGTPDRSFTGQDQDVVTGSAGTGTYDFLFRKYDPAAGRWLSPDPSGWGAVDQTTPQSLNRYAYVQNNPMSMIDPEGLDCFYTTGTGVSASGSDSAQSCAYNGGTWYQGTQTYLPTTDAYGNSMFTAVIPGYGDNSDNLIIGVTQLGGTGCNMGDALCQQLYGELTVSGNQNNAATNAPNNGQTQQQQQDCTAAANAASKQAFDAAKSHMPDGWTVGGRVIVGGIVVGAAKGAKGGWVGAAWGALEGGAVGLATAYGSSIYAYGTGVVQWSVTSAGCNALNTGTGWGTAGVTAP